ncbi:MAB_1171c family putative transporter [Kitasatospora viridis]|uniref:DUF6545 domain-containing protein n=1 Tax=Kitasatospora viridis TaxID=281105 RepID=A0A561S9W9_9ACTN|nr:MAB_1171c family putative transporter [Kitasatospora viridis]TWF71670.1 hypothetical protein FHX73_1841 [Kitasatospora viridis]
MIIWLFVILPLWVVVIARTPVAIRQRRSRPLYGSFLSLSISLTAIRPQVVDLLYRWTHIAGLADLIKQVSGMVAMAFILSWVVSVTPPPRPGQANRLYFRIARGRTRHVVTTICVSLAVGLFPFMDTADRALPDSPDLALTQIGHPLGAVSMQTFQIYLCFSMISCALMCWDAWHRDRRSILGLSMWCVAFGCAAGFCYGFLRLTYLVGIMAGASLPSWVLYVGTNGFVLLSVGFILVGTSLPVLERIKTELSYRSSLIKLRALWDEVTSAVPAVVYCGPRKTTRLNDRLNLRHLDERLHRRIVEIEDGAMALQTWCSASLGHAVREAASGADLLFAQALIIRIAANRKRQGSPAAEVQDTEPLLPTSPSPRVRLAYLEQLSWAIEPRPEMPDEEQINQLLPNLDTEFLNQIRFSLGLRTRQETQ